MITPQISSLQWSRQVVPYLKHFSTSTSISHGFYDSHSNTSSTNEAGNIQEQMSTKRSARKEFRSIPVHSSILNAIEAMGVGMRPMQAKSRYLKSVKLTRRKLLKGEDINEKDERNILRNRNSESKMVSLVEPISASPHMWMPLLPFGNILPTHLSRQEGILEQIKVKKLPIKVLGSAGSRNDELPRSTKGIPEIAIAGRSNVGKSTLLNALLYGNQFSSTLPETRKFTRGKTPDGAKLPKGPKAIVSDLPGETKRITFYQVSTQISYVDSNIHQKEETVDDNNVGLRIKKTVSQQKTIQADQTIQNSVKEKENISLLLIDLPGYGFAYTSDENIHEWKDLMLHFLIERGHMLKRILLLIDARHGFKKADFDFLDILQQTLISHPDDDNNRLQSKRDVETRKGLKQNKRNLPPIQVVLTKCDLVQQKDLARRVVQVKRQLSESLIRESKGNLPIMLVSAKAGLGYNNIRGSRARGGILELQRELASIAPRSKLVMHRNKTRKK